MKQQAVTPIGVLVSGSGTNLQALLDANAADRLGSGKVVVVISNRPKAQALERASRAGVPAFAVSHRKHPERERFEREMIRILDGHGVTLVVLAGFMRLLTPLFLDRYPGRILNIHPALLPAFPGVDGQGQAHDYGVRISGCTVHFVSRGTDMGPIIVQAAVPAAPGEGRDALQKRILVEEHRILPQAVAWVCENRVWLDQGRVRYRDIPPATGSLVYPPVDTGR